MATSDTEKYVRINLMLVKGGTLLTKRLFRKRVKDLSPAGVELTVEQFLTNNKPTILSKRTGKNYHTTIYPPSGDTDIDKWDLYLLCFILQEVGGLIYINKKDIEKLQGMRNKLFHLPQPVLNAAVYEERLVKTKAIFNRTCDLIGDDIFKKEIMDIIEDFEKQPIAVEELALKNHEMNRMESRWLQILDQQDTIRQNTEKIINNQAENMSTLLSRLDALELKLPPNTNVDVPGLPVTIEVKNCPKDKEKALLDCLVNEFQSVIANPECELRKRFPYLDSTVLTEAVVTAFKGFIAKRMHVVNAQNKCLLLTIKCEDISSFVSLVRSCMDGSLLNQLDELRNAVRRWEGCGNVDFELAISEDEIITVIIDLASQDSQIVQQPEQVRQVSLDGNGLIHPDSEMLTTEVTIQPSTYQCHEELQNILESEVFQNELDGIQSKARDVTGCAEVVLSIRHTLSANDRSKSDEMQFICGETVSTTELRKGYEPDGNLKNDDSSGYIGSELPFEKLSPGKSSDQIEKDLFLSGNKIGAKRDVDDNHKSTSEVEPVGFGIHSVNDEDSTSFERYSDTHYTVIGWEASQNVDDADENESSKPKDEDAMNSSTQSKELLPKYDVPFAVESFEEKKEPDLNECYQKDKIGESIDDIKTEKPSSLCQGKISTFTKRNESPTNNNSNELPPENSSDRNVFVSMADAKPSSAEVICDSASSTENVIYTRTIEEIDNGVHPNNDPDDPLAASLDDDSFSESESESLNLMLVTSKIGIPGLLTSAKEKLYFADLDGACNDVKNAISLLDIEKGKTLAGQNTETSESQLAKWYEDCSFILSQHDDYYSDVLDEILCYYNGILFDQRWKPGRRHSEIVDILLDKLHYELRFYRFLSEKLVEELEKIAVIAKERGRPQLCISIDRDIDRICRYYSDADKNEEPRWKEALLRSARCYLDLELNLNTQEPFFWRS